MNRDEVLAVLKELDEEAKKIADDQARSDEMQKIEEFAAAYDGEDKVISSHEIAQKIRTREPIKTIPTGIKKFDDILGGFVKKQLVVIAAPTKMGKTSFCIDLTSRLKEMHPLWFPFEEPAEELIQKFIDRKEDPPLFYTPEKITGNTLKWIEKKIIEAKVKYGSEVIFIDHLHFIVPFSAERQDLLIGSVMRDLKSLAKRMNILIFLISHLKKTRIDRNPDLEDLRDSSFTAQEADTVIILWRKTRREEGEVVVTNEVNVSVQANRRTGKTGNVHLLFENGRFIEITEKYDNDLEEFVGRPTPAKKERSDKNW